MTTKNSFLSTIVILLMLRKGVEMMRKLTSDGTTDIDMVEYGLQQIGYSLESLCDDLGETLLKVG